MNKDQVKGRTKTVKGKLREMAGKTVGNRKEEAKGKLEKHVGRIQSDYGDAKRRLEKDIEEENEE